MRYIYKNKEDVDWDNVTICSDPYTGPYERETVINMNDDEDMASLYSAQPAWIKYLVNHEHFEINEDGVTMVDDDRVVAVKGTMPKNCIRASKHPRQRFDKL